MGKANWQFQCSRNFPVQICVACVFLIIQSIYNNIYIDNLTTPEERQKRCLVNTERDHKKQISAIKANAYTRRIHIFGEFWGLGSCSFWSLLTNWSLVSLKSINYQEINFKKHSEEHGNLKSNSSGRSLIQHKGLTMYPLTEAINVRIGERRTKKMSDVLHVEYSSVRRLRSSDRDFDKC